MSGEGESDSDYRGFMKALLARGILAEEPVDGVLPGYATMHNRAADIPKLVVSPRNEDEVVVILRLLHAHRLYAHSAVSVKSGGHGYFNGASCTGIMINLAFVDQCRRVEDTLVVEPGCILGRVVHELAKNRKAVPHGDCFGVGAGGHFLTAGWDLILARRYGLGCQAVVGGRIALWDGTVVDVHEKSHPELLWAMRGGAAAAVGVVTQIRLRLFDEPSRVTWKLTPLDAESLAFCTRHEVFFRATQLPEDISVSFHFHYDADRAAPVCSFNVFSLWPVAETLSCLRECLGPEITGLVEDSAGWMEKPLLDFRLLPASQTILDHPDRLADLTMENLHRHPTRYWLMPLVRREMADSYLSTVSTWIPRQSDGLLNDMYHAFDSIREHPLRDRMYALVIIGGGRIQELASTCSMPLGEALARFEVHWDKPGADAEWSEAFVGKIAAIFASRRDPIPGRPYRGDIWLQEQASDEHLAAVLRRYDRRFLAPE